MTVFRVSRAWMGCTSIGDYELYYHEYSLLKIYEVRLESVPTKTIQIHIALVTRYSDSYDETSNLFIALIASIGITFI